MTKPFRVIQWATGPVGQLGIRHFGQNRTYRLVGGAVTDPAKHGRDLGEIAGIGPLGVSATTDHAALLEVEADCVFYAPKVADAAEICRILRSGKNVVSTTGYFHPTPPMAEDFASIEQACRDGGVSYFGGGIHPGFSGDLLPLTLCRLNSRVDKVQVYEIVDFMHSGAGAARYLGQMAFGVTEAEFAGHPHELTDSLKYFEQCMALVAEGLGETVEKVTSRIELGLAQSDMDFHGFPIPAGTVAAQHHEWTAWCRGRPLVVFHAIYTVGYDGISPVWNLGEIHYRVRIEGDPDTQVDLSGQSTANSIGHPYGYVWTAMASLNAIPAICAAPPGVKTHRDLAPIHPKGLVRD